jgi:protocatechuate 3,4-dioxygenase, beta subunit
LKTACLLFLAFFSLQVCAQAPHIADKDAPWRVSITSKEEPGERLIVKGRVLEHEGTTPVAGASIYVYHTDARGYYTPENNDNKNPRLRGYMRADSQGRYEFTTIKPGPYPNNHIPAHIHYVVNADGYRERVFEIVFEGDPFLDAHVRSDSAKEDSGFSIRPLERDNQGVLRCAQDIKLRRYR